jgi:hypothetical protein
MSDIDNLTEEQIEDIRAAFSICKLLLLWNKMLILI